MNICIIGGGLTSLSLAKNLINKKINVENYQEKKIKVAPSNRTIGIARNNLKFFEKEVHVFKKKDAWGIKKIEIFNEKIKNSKILNFENRNQNLFYMIKNDKLCNLLNDKLKQSKYYSKKIIKSDDFYKKLLKKNKFDLIINCESKNYLSKKIFHKKIDKDYYNLAFTTIIEHKKIENRTAIQIFTNFGPIAFLPISNKETSVVCSVDVKNNNFSKKNILDLIKKIIQNIK